MINYWDFVAYLHTLNYRPVCYVIPYGDDKLKEGSRNRVVEYLRNDPYLVNLVSRIEEMEQMENEPANEEQYNEWKKRISYSLFSIIQDGRHCYRKVLVLDGKEYRISPVTEQEFTMFHGGSIECFKKDFGYKELSDFTPEQLGRSELNIYAGNNGMPLSWSDWNCCLNYGEETEEVEKIMRDACIRTNFLWEWPRSPTEVVQESCMVLRHIS